MEKSKPHQQKPEQHKYSNLEQTFSKISINSLEIFRKQFQIQPFSKYQLIFILDANIQQTDLKKYRNLSNKYRSQYYSSWKEYELDLAKIRKEKIAISKKKQVLQIESQQNLVISTEQYAKEILRELKLNPSLHVALKCSEFKDVIKYKDTNIKYVFREPSELEEYLLHNKNKLLKKL